MMKKLALIVLLFIGGINLSAQADEDFDKLGFTLYRHLTDTSFNDYVPIIRIMQYHDLINDQDFTEREKEKRHFELENDYDRINASYEISNKSLGDHYKAQQIEGAQLEYLKTRHFPLDDLSNTYEIETSFLYNKGEVQNEVILKYKVAWLAETQSFWMISGIKENF